MKKLISIILSVAIAAALCVGAQARLVGDIDSNGKVTSADALSVLQYSVGSLSNINTKYADVNGDGHVNSNDALTILQICVGSYKGDVEVDDGLVTSYKADKIDPIMKSGKYTMKTIIDNNGKPTPTMLEVNGANIAATIVYEAITMRFLILDGKGYMVFPTMKVYSEMSEPIDIDMSQSKDSTYIGSEYVTTNGVKYVCEHYKSSDGATSDYYFLNGEWKMFSSTADGETLTQEITAFYTGVDESSFSLKGLTKVNLDNLI